MMVKCMGYYPNDVGKTVMILRYLEGGSQCVVKAWGGIMWLWHRQGDIIALSL
jgi:hypothetical protein